MGGVKVAGRHINARPGAKPIEVPVGGAGEFRRAERRLIGMKAFVDRPRVVISGAHDAIGSGMEFRLLNKLKSEPVWQPSAPGAHMDGDRRFGDGSGRNHRRSQRWFGTSRLSLLGEDEQSNSGRRKGDEGQRCVLFHTTSPKNVEMNNRILFA